ncbi:hypothetical protein ACFO26_01600 [Lactococcus nasutitermitis]|uniref:LXG domain-containing protein n=1 Tax=Lactococcus nasutitermitis TaxID=1652957 RepID=A0ABV9JDZ2_9LACT|nr:hypothetical protein [Lactococcus nasutitermitis]
MVVYDSGDSDRLMQALTANLNGAKEIFMRLSKGSAYLIAVINSGTLSGAAYTAGKELFETYINPMLQKLSKAITDIEEDLNAYRSADSRVRQYESHLDEALLKKQLNTTKEMIRLLQQKIDDDKNFFKNLEDAVQGDFSRMAELPSLQEQLDNLEQVKTMYEQELAALETFVSSTASLFTDSLEAFKLALQGVSIINQSHASANGTITFPAGADMSWAKKLKNEKFSSKLNASSKPKKVSSSKTKVTAEDILSFAEDTQSVEDFFRSPSKSFSDWLNTGNILNKYYMMLPKSVREINENSDNYNEHLKNNGEAELYKLIGGWGTLEFGKTTTENSIINGKIEIPQKGRPFGKEAPSDTIHTGPTIGGAFSLFDYTHSPVSIHIPHLPALPAITPEVKVGNGKLDAYLDKNSNGFNIGGDAEISAAEADSSFKVDIPFTNSQLTVGSSISVASLGATGHITSTNKGFSAGFKFAYGMGGGVDFGVSKK